MDDDRFDGLYLNVAQTTRGIEPLLHTVFSFLRRKTDFFAGPPGFDDEAAGTAKAIETVQQVVNAHAELYRQEQQKKKRSQPKKKKAPSKEKMDVETTKMDVVEPKEEEEEEVIEMGTDGQFDASPPATASTTKETVPPANAKEEEKESTKKSATDSSSKDESDDKDDDDDKQEEPPPLGNGGTVPGKYVWTQTLSELLVNVPVPEHTRGRDLKVQFAKQHLKVQLVLKDDKRIFIDDKLTKPIICDDSFWTIEDGNRLVLNLQKLNQMEWWDSVCENDQPKINVQKIQPENSSLGDLDGETRKTVEKMMYDQRQKAMGLPSSEEEQKLAMLEKFKHQHPELDFSNTKIS